jgi:hypothetical protein
MYVPKTHCPHGHPYDDENTHIDAHGYKHCRTCQRERMADRRARGLETVRSKSRKEKYRPERVGTGGRNKAKTHCPKGHPYDEENTILSKDGRRCCRTCAKANSAVQNMKRYGITREEFDALLERQNGRCAICGESFGDVAPHIDHDHSCCPREKACGKCVRGLLCASCNRGLGCYRDSPERLFNAAVYLERF